MKNSPPTTREAPNFKHHVGPATILHLPGMDREKLTFCHGGRDYRLTDVHGNVAQALPA